MLESCSDPDNIRIWLPRDDVIVGESIDFYGNFGDCRVYKILLCGVTIQMKPSVTIILRPSHLLFVMWVWQK